MEYVVVFLYGVLILLISIFFYRKNRSIRELHHKRNFELIEAIYTHRSQIGKRQHGLDGYDFQQYNLRKSLIVQEEISLEDI